MGNNVFVIEDEIHAENFGQFTSFAAALEKLKEMASSPWDGEINRPPCQNWKTCERVYVIIEYDVGSKPWKELKSTTVLTISAAGIIWKQI